MTNTDAQNKYVCYFLLLFSGSSYITSAFQLNKSDDDNADNSLENERLI